MEQQYYEPPRAEAACETPVPEKRVYSPLQRWLLAFTLVLGAIVAFSWFGESSVFQTVRDFAPAYAAFWAV